MTLKKDFTRFKTELDTTLEIFGASVVTACFQVGDKQFDFFKEELKVKNTSSFFVETILGSIFIGLAGQLIKQLASKIFTPMIKTRALIVRRGDNVIVSKLSKAELENFKNTSLPDGMNFLSYESSDSFAKTLFTGVLDTAAKKLIPRALASSSSSQTKKSFHSTTDTLKTQFKEIVDNWILDFKMQQNIYIDEIIDILDSQQLSSDLEKGFSAELDNLRSTIPEVSTGEQMRQIRYYYELCIWSLYYRDIIFHGIQEEEKSTYNDVTLRQARSGQSYQYPYPLNDIKAFKLPKNIPKYVYDYWTKQFPHPLDPNVSFEDYYYALKPTVGQRYNVAIMQGGFKRTQDPRYLEPFLEAEKFYDLTNYMQRIEKQFEGASNFTEFVR